MSTKQIPNESSNTIPPGSPNSTELAHESATPVPWSPSERQSVAFTRAVLTFKDELDHVRHKNMEPYADGVGRSTAEEKQRPESMGDKLEIEMTPTYPNKVERYDGRIRILRAIQHGLTSVISIIIAVLQSLTYIKYQQTKGVQDAWPQHPTLVPTLLLLAVAIMALMFDISSLIAYLMPGKRIAERAFRLAINLHYWITGAKSLSYVVAASVCRAGFSMGDNKDLWGWSCSKTGQEMESVNNAKSNCTGNTVAWVLAIINIVIEIIGVIITFCIMKRDDKDYQAVPLNTNAANNPNPTTTGSPSSPLLVRSLELDSRGNDLHNQLGELSPSTKA